MAGDCCRQPDYLPDFAAGLVFLVLTDTTKGNPMKHITLAALLLAAMLPVQAAVYACKDASGRTTYTQDPRGKNCQTSVRPYTPLSSLPPTAPHTRPGKLLMKARPLQAGKP